MKNPPKGPPSPAEIAASIMAQKGVGRSLPVDPNALLVNELVEIEYFHAEHDIEGRFELCEGRPTIFVNTRGWGRDHPRVRFTAAHEGGHFFQHRHLLRVGHVFRDDEIDLDQEARLKNHEREANEFAIEVLLPSRLLRERFERTPVIGIDVITKLAYEANVSLQATAIRVARETADRICVLLANRGVVEWVVASDDWRQAKLPAGQLKKKPIPVGSVAARQVGDYSEERVPCREWAANQAWRDADLFESAVDTPYGRLIFLGAGAESDDDDQEEDDPGAGRY